MAYKNLKIKSHDWFKNYVNQAYVPTVGVSATSTYKYNIEVFDNIIRAEFGASAEDASFHFTLPFAIRVLTAEFLSDNSVANGNIQLNSEGGIIGTWTDATTVSVTYQATNLDHEFIAVDAGSTLTLVCGSTGMSGIMTITYVPQTSNTETTGYGTPV